MTKKDARGLDDIIVKRSDQLMALIQVKFTVDPIDPANDLSWAYLTARKSRTGKSLLKKWSSAAFSRRPQAACYRAADYKPASGPGCKHS